MNEKAPEYSHIDSLALSMNRCLNEVQTIAKQAGSSLGQPSSSSELYLSIGCISQPLKEPVTKKLGGKWVVKLRRSHRQKVGSKVYLAVFYASFRSDAFLVRLNRSNRYVQQLGYLLRGFAILHKIGYLYFLGGKTYIF